MRNGSDWVIQYLGIYGPAAACGAGHVNCGVVCRNGGVAAAARCYSQSGVSENAATTGIIDEYIICNYRDGVDAAGSNADGNAAWAVEIDTRKREGIAVDGNDVGGKVASAGSVSHDWRWRCAICQRRC